MKKNKGISLIVLVVTIIVIIIIAGSVVLSLLDNSPVPKASEAAFKLNVEAYNLELSSAISAKYLSLGNYDISGFNLSVWDGNPAIEHVTGTTKEYIPSMTLEDAPKFEVQDGRLVYVGSDTLEESWLIGMGIDIAP